MKGKINKQFSWKSEPIFEKILYFRFPKYPTTMTTKLAFIYVVHQQVSLFEILLHLTFRPYNAYCIYVGSNTKAIITNTITKLIDCYKEMYPNTSIFMAQGTSEVKWGRFSLLEGKSKK